MGDPNTSIDITSIPSFCRELSFMKTDQAIDKAIRRDDELYLRRHLKQLKQKKAEGLYYAVNLSGDPLLSVLISYKKTELAKKLLECMDDDESLLQANLQGDTALHVAAAVGDEVMDIAGELIAKNKDLLNKRNEEQETPLLKAALHGQRGIFWMLYGYDNSIIEVKRKDGSNVLHCAIMANAPRLALDIAENFPHLKRDRNIAGATPLHLIVTIPEAFKSTMNYGYFQSFIYKYCINICDGDQRGLDLGQVIDVVQSINDEENPQLQRITSFPPITVSELLMIDNVSGSSRKRVGQLEKQKRKHKEIMVLIDCLARDVYYWDFIGKGKTAHFDESRSLSIGNDHKSIDDGHQRWNDSPLIAGAKMGHHEFVKKILEVYPQSVNILDCDGNNIIQVAVLHKRWNIFNLVASKLTNINPLLPSRLLYARDDNNNTILHHAANITDDEEMVSDEKMTRRRLWILRKQFEKVEKLMPGDLKYSRNAKEMTAQEVFSENQKIAMKATKPINLFRTFLYAGTALLVLIIKEIFYHVIN